MLQNRQPNLSGANAGGLDDQNLWIMRTQQDARKMRKTVRYPQAKQKCPTADQNKKVVAGRHKIRLNQQDLTSVMMEINTIRGRQARDYDFLK